MAEWYHALQNELAPFILEGRFTNRRLGEGSYGSVEEVQIIRSGYICAGKKIHEVLLDPDNEGQMNIARRFMQECQLMSTLRHPNITQFLGLCFLPGPVLLMEKLEDSLDNLLESIRNIPLSVKRSLLEDVAMGLHYLHTCDPQIIHRDLTAKNVLLTSSLQCKITDFGNSRIVNPEVAQTQSNVPGTLSYMPPEALPAEATPDYGPSLDIFSFGHLALFTLIQVFPCNLLPSTYHNSEGDLVARSEIERRQDYLNCPEGRSLGDQHPLIMMMRCCLENRPSERPTSEQLVTCLVEMKADIEGPLGDDAARIDIQRQIVSMRAINARDATIREKNGQIEQLQRQIEQIQTDYNAEVAQKNHDIQQRDVQLEEAREQRAQLQTEVATLEESQQQTIQEKDERIQEKETELERVRGQLNELQQQLQTQALQAFQRMQQKDTEIQRLQEELHEKNISCERESQQKDTEINRSARLQEELELLRVSSEEEKRGKDSTISRLQREVQRIRGSYAAEMQQKDTEINRLQEELGQLQVPTNSPLRLEWSKGRDLPFGIRYYPQAVVLDGKVYIGGGKASSDGEAQTVVVYDPQRDSWSMLPCYMCIKFAMTAVNNTLVLAGGEQVQSEDVTNVVGVWDKAMQEWSHPFLPMPTARDAPTAVTYEDRWVIVVGGQNNKGEDLAMVEILDMHRREWYYGASLPQPLSHLSSTIVGDRLYLLGGFSKSNPSRRVLHVQLIDLISKDDSHLPSSPTLSPWQTLSAESPFIGSTALALGGTLMSIGGGNRMRGNTSIYMYQPSSLSWIEVGMLPSARHQCVCVILPCGKMFVACGDVSQLQVDIATIFQRFQYHYIR